MHAITEPATLVTDYLLAAFTAVLAWKLSAGGLPQRLWAAAFLATSVAGLAGGTVHGFSRILSASLIAALWLLTLEMLVVAALMIALALLASIPIGARARRATAVLIVAAFAVWAAWIPSRPVFGAAIAAYGASLLVLSAAEVWRWRASRLAASGPLLAGVVVSVLAAAIQQLGWAPHRHFNHNDLYHVVQAGAVWLLYQGARRLPDATSQPRSGPTMP